VLILLGVVIGGLIALALLGRSPLWELATGAGPRQPRLGLTLHGQVQAATRHEITAPAAGKVAGLMVSPGQSVAAGQELLQLDAPALRRRLVAAQQDVARLQALHEKSKDRRVQERLDKAEALLSNVTGILQERRQQLDDFRKQNPGAVIALDTLAQARDRLDAADQALREAEQQFQTAAERAGATGKPDPNLPRLKSERDQCLAEREAAHAATADATAAHDRRREEIQRLAALTTGVDHAVKLQRDLQAQLERVKKEPEVAMLLQGARRIQQAQDRVTELERQVAALSVRAPAAGVLQDLRARPGQAVTQAEVVAVIADAGPRLVFTASAADVARLAIGWRVTVTPAGGQPFKAAISELDPAGRLIVQPLQPQSLPPPQTPLQAKL
jgi:multidrug efflux pump subunit AcrA (membrane-fusion protein)